MLQTIITGGQTGADRAALDAALQSGFPCGGACPKGRQAEDGPIPLSYPLNEIDGGYRQRTWHNVIHSDATVIFFEKEATGGTLLTIKYCQTHKKPHLLVDISKAPGDEAVDDLVAFIDKHSVETLNVAGPRASECPHMYAFVKAVIERMIQR